MENNCDGDCFMWLASTNCSHGDYDSTINYKTYDVLSGYKYVEIERGTQIYEYLLVLLHIINIFRYGTAGEEHWWIDGLRDYLSIVIHISLIIWSSLNIGVPMHFNLYMLK